jgi:broad specificity phosphatase PhoE
MVGQEKLEATMLDSLIRLAKPADEPFLSMTTHLILVSHAPTSALRTASFPGDEPLDPPVLSLPEVSAEIETMGSLRYAFIGPEQRAAQTAAALKIKVPFVVDLALRDCAYGRWTGRSLSDLQVDEPDAIASWITEPDAAPHGGESMLAILKRVATWMDERSQIGGRILVVSHPTVIRAAIIHAILAPPQTFWRINVEPLSLTDLRGNKGRWTLRSLATPRAG